MELDARALAFAFVSPGSEEEASYRRVLEGEVELVTTSVALFEFAKILVDGFGWNAVMAEHVVTHVARVATEVIGAPASDGV